MSDDKIAGQKFLAGDIGFSTSNDFVSKAIRFFTSLQTKNAKKSHTFAFVTPSLIVEAVAKIQVNPASKYAQSDIAVYRIPLSFDEQKDFEIGMLRQVRRAYGYLKIPLFALDAIATKITSLFGRKTPVFFFTKYVGIFNIPVCSQLVLWGLYKFTSYKLKDAGGNIVSWRIVSPDYFEDLLKLPVNEAMLIYSQKAVDAQVIP